MEPIVVKNATDSENIHLVDRSPNVPASSAGQPVEQAPASGPNLGTFGEESLVDQHALRAARTLYSVHDATPRVLVAILAKQKEAFLPLYLDCIEALDYPKSSIVLYVRTNNNTDATETILRDWLARVGHLYAHVEFDPADVDAKVEQFGAHEWNVQRFEVLGHIRNVSLLAAKTHGCDYYFVVDVDNFVRPCTLGELVALRLPIVSPLLRLIVPGAFYSNYHAEIDVNGYYRDCEQYQWILNRWIRGVIEVPVVHCTYLVRTDVIDHLTYIDGSFRYEYVVFSDSARKANVPQYVDNRQIYGYITFGEGHASHDLGGLDHAKKLIADAHDERSAPATLAKKPKQSARRRSARGKLIISPQAGFGNRLRALSTGILLGLMTGREVFHYWVHDPELSHVEHVNHMKAIGPDYIFDAKIPLWDRPRVDVCFSEWMPGDFWFSQQSTAQHALTCDRTSKLSSVTDILQCNEEIILIESSLELIAPEAAHARAELMHAVYKAYLPLNKRWQLIRDNSPRYDVGVSIRRGNHLIFNPRDDLDGDEAAQRLAKWPGTKIVFSDDDMYAEALMQRLAIPLDLNSQINAHKGPDRYIAQFIILSKALQIVGTSGSSFPEQSAIYGGRPFMPI